MIFLFVSGAAVLKKVEVPGIEGKIKIKSIFKEDSVERIHEYYKFYYKEDFGTYDEMQMYIVCILAGIAYIVAVVLDFTKFFVRFRCCKNFKWLYVIIGRLLLTGFSIAGCACNHNFWKKAKKCQEKVYKNYSWNFDDKMQPYKMIPTLKKALVAVIICSLFASIFDIIVSILFRQFEGTERVSGPAVEKRKLDKTKELQINVKPSEENVLNKGEAAQNNQNAPGNQQNQNQQSDNQTNIDNSERSQQQENQENNVPEGNQEKPVNI